MARSRTRTLSTLVAPSIILLLLINIYPLFYAASQSVHNGTLLSGGSFVGLHNFADVLTSDDFVHASTFTAIFTAAGVFGSWLVGLCLALLFQLRISAKGVFRVLLLLPWVVPVVVSSTAWNWLLATPQSPIPRLAKVFGFSDVLFLAEPTSAAIVLCLFKIWVSFPFMMLMSSAALTSIDDAIYEAASMDGASAWQKLTRITLPLIARPTYVSWVLMTIFCVNDFATIFLLTGGGPVGSTTTLSLLAYQRVFQEFQVGSGVAIAFLLTLFLAAVSVILHRQIRRTDA
jgi:multiple sugar transport system permease protein